VPASYLEDPLQALCTAGRYRRCSLAAAHHAPEERANHGHLAFPAVHSRRHFARSGHRHCLGAAGTRRRGQRPPRQSMLPLIMSIGSPGFRPGGAGRPPRVLPVMCGNCGTDRHLTIRSVTHLPDDPADVELVSYTCDRCRRFSEHPAWVADLAEILARVEQTGDVLILGGHYMHCGQPMEKARSELRRLSAAQFTSGEAEDSLDVYLSTRVLRCVCGFQMEVPE
jgi:hypothetical protein